MNSKKVYFGMLGLCTILALGIFGAAYGAKIILKKQSDKLYDAKLSTAVLDKQQLSLAQAKKDIETYAELGREAKIIVPQDKDQAEAVREIVKLASNSGVKLSGISFPTSNLGVSSKTNTPEAQSSKPPVSQVESSGIKGVYVMPITVQATDASNPVPYGFFTYFLSLLEQNRRTSLVSSINIQPSQKDESLINFTLIVNEYIKP